MRRTQRERARHSSMRHVVSAAILALVSIHHASSQDAVGDFLRYGDLVYVEAAQLPTAPAAKCRVDVMVRIAYDYLVFIKSGRAHPDSLYTAGVNVAIDVMDTRHNTVYASDEKTVLYAPDFATTNTRDAYVLLKHTMEVEPGDCTVQVGISDQHSTRERRIPLRIKVRSVSGDAITILSALPVSVKPSFELPQVACLGFGGRFLFGAGAYLAVTAAAPSDANWVFHLRRVKDDDRLDLWSDTLPPFKTIDRLSGARRNGVVGDFRMEMFDAPLNASVRLFQLPLDTLPFGNYELEIVASSGSASDAYKLPFSIFWKDMPLSLKNLDLALGVMRYILSEEEYDAVNTGSDEERMEHILAYWKARDPNPATPYNEAMTEFFRRADQAYYKFQTTNLTNGALTDRGKIFILYGAPDAVDRQLEPGAPPQEVWTYRSLDKTIRFVDRHRNGNLRLVQ
jgi:GWxTD domain-containing protein